MTEAAARALIEGAIDRSTSESIWADLGSGAGTFAEALAGIIGPTGTVYAIDASKSQLHTLRNMAAYHQRAHDGYASIIAQQGDFTQPLSLPPLSGILLANALHFVASHDQAAILSQLSRLLRPEGRIVLVEYDREVGHQWVPYPVSAKALPALAARGGLGNPQFVATAPSAFGGDLYSAWMSLT